MIAAQPLLTRPQLSDPALVLAALNPLAGAGVRDASAFGNDGVVIGTPIMHANGEIELDGIGDRIDFGDLGTVVEVSAWVNPVTVTEALFRFDVGSYIHIVAGTVTYVGLTAVATFVNGVASTTLAASEWQHIVCRSEAVVTANGFHLGWDDANYGAVSVRDLRVRTAFSESPAHNYGCGVPDDSLRLRLHRHRYDLSRYAAVYDAVGGIVLGNNVELDGTTGYLQRTVAGWRSADHVGTVVGWIWRDASGADARAIWASSDQGADQDFVLWTIAANSLWITSDSGGAGYNNLLGTATISSGRWYHVALVSTGSEYLAYVNGEPDALTVNSGANNGVWLADCANRDNVTVGAWNHNGLQEYFFNGKIDDLRYYSEAKPGDWLRDDYRRNVIYR